MIEKVNVLEKLSLKDAAKQKGLTTEEIDAALTIGREERDTMEAQTRRKSLIDPRIRFT